MNRKAEIERIMKDLAPRADGTTPTINSRYAARVLGIPHDDIVGMIDRAIADGAPPEWFTPRVETDEPLDRPLPAHVEFPPHGSMSFAIDPKTNAYAVIWPSGDGFRILVEDEKRIGTATHKPVLPLAVLCEAAKMKWFPPASVPFRVLPMCKEHHDHFDEIRRYINRGMEPAL